ncbi:hypothetical protein A1O7_07359 [Cladophialophora yegresii CBS 114405]|uniref:DUF1989 domain-containing protein n=1 Tax=Cladophialophora yegresii CBS 114405 TaxID=1182544 RepID=W9VWE8_9EURO|nr:uncharacterized protein A1O7_07359 [Cladophialophora yegresii CBS 114405]EXJ57015.1 hypothetical protein A1O7_07359 [Cladophialophora yegresii CBS 114405]
MSSITIPARTGAYVGLKKGQRLKLINPHGNQVIDFWAFVFPGSTADDIPRSFICSPQEASEEADATPFPFSSGVQYFSASRTRSILSKLIPSAETHDVLYTNKSVPLFTLLEDTTTGIHDTLFGCCDRFRYHNLGIDGYDHGSCAENMHIALREAAAAGLLAAGSISTEWTPDPLNVFMNVPITTPLDRQSGGGKIECIAPESRPGEYMVLRAESDCVAVMSACPNDVIPGVNGGVCTDAQYEVLA